MTVQCDLDKRVLDPIPEVEPIGIMQPFQKIRIFFCEPCFDTCSNLVGYGRKIRKRINRHRS